MAKLLQKNNYRRSLRRGAREWGVQRCHLLLLAVGSCRVGPGPARDHGTHGRHDSHAAKSRSDVGVQGGQIQRPLPGSSVGQRRAVQWADSGGGVTGQHPIPKHTRQRRARHLPQGLLYATSMANMPCKLAEPRMCAQPVTHKRTGQGGVHNKGINGLYP